MASSKPDHLDLSEKGEAFSETPSSASPVSPSATVHQQGEENRDTSKEQILGRTGCALWKRWCREWAFFPALEAEFSLALDDWAAKAQNTFRQLKALEQKNLGRKDGQADDGDHRPGHAYEQKREDLMMELTIALEKFGRLFSLANNIMHQHAPNPVLVEEYRSWSLGLLNKPETDPSHLELGADNYRALGSRPSMIDEFLHSLVKAVAILWARAKSFLSRLNSKESAASPPVSIILSYPTLRVLSHLLVVVMAVVFFVMPLSIMYLVHMDKLGSVLVTISFSLLFCIGSFYFGGGSGGLGTDTKFLLLFAYTSVMATLLSNLAQHQERT